MPDPRVIGDYTLRSVVTSTFALDGGAMFGVVPKTLWSKAVEVDELNRIAMVTRTLLLESKDRKILIDTGNGDKWQQRFRDMYKIEVEGHILPQSLAALGIHTDEITDIICTHLHFDHVGGNTSLVHDRVEPVFSHATYWVQKENFELAIHPNLKDRASYLSENWDVLRENGLLKILDGDREFLPGIDLHIVHGHTLGQQLPLIHDSSQALFYGGDLFPMKPHIPIPWIMAYDNEPLRSAEEKKRILPQLLEMDAAIFFEHDPATPACKLSMTDRGIIGGETLLI